jgi:hypothetical protein
LFAKEFGYPPETTENLSFLHRWMLIEGHNEEVKRTLEDYDPDAAGYGGSPTSRPATWTDERDDAPLHHYPRATDPMATAEELITLGVSYRQE